ncbi:MAG: preprotein translocase subunit SecE [Clostridiaceae bacterium]|jgi:preprotein translocase subunit SecE|nr:preprotein translocase subunit SecE [Clostridiaceae bacterium]
MASKKSITKRERSGKQARESRKGSGKTSQKGSKPSFGARIGKWFSNIINELKRVIWPDKKKLKQSTLTVLLIIFLAVVTILVFDAVVRLIFTVTGLYSTKEPTPTVPLPIETQLTDDTDPVETTDETTEASESEPVASATEAPSEVTEASDSEPVASESETVG